jgi:beta-barrel assembly-enhancing protease
MNRVFATAMVIMLLMVCPARATIAPAPTLQSRPGDPVEDTTRLVQQAFIDITHNDTASGQVELDKAIDARGFAGLPADMRYRALLVASLIAQQNGQNTKAHDLIVRATAFDGAGDTAWTARLSTAFSLAKYADAAHSLTILAQRWPGTVSALQPDAIMQLHYQLKLAHDHDAERAMLDALFDAKWQVKGVEPSSLWRALALLCIQRDDVARATTVALRITSGRVALSMLVDKRFDFVTRKYPQVFGVDRLVATEIKTAQARAKTHPDQLAPVTALQDLFLMTGQYPRVFSISDAAVARAEHGNGQKTYADFDDRYNWVLDNRARALQREGRWDDAVHVRVLAARRPEHGGMNVSQLINLGALYADLDQYDKAADAIIELGNMSPMGRMQLESVKLRIAIGKKDDAAIDTVMTYMREHRADDVATWEDALLLRGELDAAAALLVERLENPAWRNDALVDMQHYVHVTGTPVQDMIQERWNTISARPDVQAAMLKVGRVEQFHVVAAPH